MQVRELFYIKISSKMRSHEHWGFLFTAELHMKIRYKTTIHRYLNFSISVDVKILKASSAWMQINQAFRLNLSKIYVKLQTAVCCNMFSNKKEHV